MEGTKHKTGLMIRNLQFKDKHPDKYVMEQYVIAQINSANQIMCSYKPILYALYTYDICIKGGFRKEVYYVYFYRLK